MRKSLFCLLTAVLFLSLATPGLAATLSLNAGWNLVSSRAPITVAQTFNTPQIVSCWSWDTTLGAWKVYLPKEGDGGQGYATGKGFSLLTDIAPANGFWVNVTDTPTTTFPLALTLSGTETTASVLGLKPGWNLMGVPSASPISATTFAAKGTFTSVWKWSGSTWSVFLPGETIPGAYAASKGFSALATLQPGDGFWVNCGATAETQVTVVEQPPLMGKVSEVVDKSDKASYKPLAGAEVWVNGLSVGKTDSQGVFQATNYGESVLIAIKQEGYVDSSETFTVPESKQLYLFVQKQDPTTATLTATDTEVIGKASALKPTPKVITSADGTTSLQVVNMSLKKDITVAVTPYASYNTAPPVSSFSAAGLTSPEVLGGGIVNIVDASGNETDNETAGFSAKISVRTSKLLGKWTVEALEKKVNTDKTGKIHLFTRSGPGWAKVGDAIINTIDDKTQIKALMPAPGISTSALAHFVFVLDSIGEAPKTDQVTGTVIDSLTQQGVPGVYVGMDGVDTESVTDDLGKFTIPVKMAALKELNLPAIYLYTWKDGYSSAYQQLPTSGETIAPLSVAIEKFAAMTQIQGTIKDGNGAPIADAKVTVKTPSVLTEILIDGPEVTTGAKIITGKEDEATFKWEILDPTDWVTVVKTIQAKGKNTLATEDINSLITAQTSDTYFPIHLEVTHGGGNGASFVEMANGGAYVYTFSDGTQTVQEIWFDLVPDYSNFSFMDTWTDGNGVYEFYGIEEKLTPFLTANAVATGFASAPFTPLPAADQEGTYTLDFALIAKPPAQQLAWEFENGAGEWTTSFTSQGAAVSSQIGWQAVTNPEQKALSIKLKESLYQPDSVWVDVVGTIVGPITIDQTQSDEFYKVATAQLSFQENNQTKTIPVILYDVHDWLTDTPPDGFYDWLEPDYNQPSASSFYLWYDSEANPNQSPTPYDSYHLQAGSTVMVSYEGPPAAPALPPAFLGSTAFWVGNQAPGADTGTYYDATLPVSTSNPVTIYDATLESPLLDLTSFSQATLQFASWFEVNAAMDTYSSLTVEVAVMDPGLADGEALLLETDWAQTTVKKGEYLPLVQYNPNSGYYTGVTPAALAKPALAKMAPTKARGGGTTLRRLTKAAAPSTALRPATAAIAPKPVKLYDSILPDDVDGDGMADSWEAQWLCAVDGNLDPMGDNDGDLFYNIEEYYDQTAPCDNTSQPLDVDVNYLLDSWEFLQTCPLVGGDPSADADNDGFSDFDEFLAQSDPCDPNSPADIDNDGMPDSWEAQWSCAVAGDLLPYADPDSDGTNNYDEYWALTDPCSGIPAPVPFSGWPLTSAGEGTAPEWMPYEINLSPYAGHTIKLRYTFSFANGKNNLYRGWAIDNVRVIDQESYRYFELLTPDFGYYGDYSYQPVTTGSSWAGNYTLAISNGTQDDMFGTQTPWTPDNQGITVNQTDLSFTTTILFAGKPCTVEGYFYDETYSALTFYFSDQATSSEISGWGDATRGTDGLITGTIAGYDWSTGGTFYQGSIVIQ